MSSRGPQALKVAAEPAGAEQIPRVRLSDHHGVPRRHPLHVAVISNPKAGRNARRGLLAKIEGVLSRHSGVVHFAERTFEGIAGATQQAIDAGAEIIAVNGGDGSVQTVLTTMLRSPLDRMPLLAVLPGGTTNTTARNVGYGSDPVASLQRLLEDSARGVVAGRVERRPIVCADLPEGPQYAMMFGAGAVYDGIVFARNQLASHGMRGQLGGGVALATFITNVLMGRAGTMFPPLAADVRLDGIDLPPARYFGMLASTMDRQFLGVSPYWGTGPGRLRFSAMRDRPRHLARAVLPALRGQPSRWLVPEHGYRSHNVDEITLGFDGGFTLDGELFPPTGRQRQVVLSSRRSAFFLRAVP